MELSTKLIVYCVGNRNWPFVVRIIVIDHVSREILQLLVLADNASDIAVSPKLESINRFSPADLYSILVTPPNHHLAKIGLYHQISPNQKPIEGNRWCFRVAKN